MNQSETTSSAEQPLALPTASEKFRRAHAWIPSNHALGSAFILLGVALRLRQYLFNRSLWCDETLLAMNILHLSPTQLLKPLENYQVAPAGFLWLEKLSVHYLGTSEMALRLVPLLGGVGSLFLFFAVARRFLDGFAVPLAVGLFAICDPLVYYASEVKQYSSDVAVVLVLYLVTESLFHANLKVSRLIFSTAVGGVAIWFSFPAVFALAGIGLAAFLVALQKHDRSSTLLLSVPCVVWAGSLLVFYFISLRQAANTHPAMVSYWQNAFAPLPPKSIADFFWYQRSFFYAFSFPGGLELTGIAAVAALIGGGELRRHDQGKFLSILLPILVALLASSLHRYPFEGRLILFLVPSLLLLVAQGLGTIGQMTATRPMFAGLLIGFLLLDPALTAARHFVKPQGVEEVRSAIDYIEGHRSPTDIVYSYYSAALPLQYYRERRRIGAIQQITGVESREDRQRYLDDLDMLRGRKRVWILFSHIYRGSGIDEEILFLDHLNQIGRRLDSMRTTGASAYLYDLSRTPASRQN